MQTKTVVIFGASGSIGKALTNRLALDQTNTVFAFSRSNTLFEQQNIVSGLVDVENEASVIEAARFVREKASPDLMIIATGLLHDRQVKPEKSIAQLSPELLSKVIAVNTVGPAITLKHFLPIMPKNKPYVIGALSARVGSISDNGLGGWYSYRASKAALNMIIKTTSIEAKRKNKQSIIVGLHPGTVDSELSKPFQRNVAEGKLFTSDYSAEKLIHVVNGLTTNETGKVFAWDGSLIEF